ncbi:MAG: type I restriction enzyme HsdR N-terminal domain-containing protein [bacterium]
MKELNLPYYPFKLKSDGERYLIMDELRKKYVVLTPEEWVRQHIVQYLINFKNYPKGLISLEKGLRVNDLLKRSDVLVFDSNTEPLLLIECKAPEVKISQEVFDQAARYNSVYKVKYILITNGLEHFCAEIEHSSSSYKFLNDIPSFNLITSKHDA